MTPTTMPDEQLKHAIRTLLETEDKTKPFSDQRISDLLRKQGIEAPRRTVAKLRKQMAFPTANTR